MMDNFYMYGYALPVWNLGTSPFFPLPSFRFLKTDTRG